MKIYTLPKLSVGCKIPCDEITCYFLYFLKWACILLTIKKCKQSILVLKSIPDYAKNESIGSSSQIGKGGRRQEDRANLRIKILLGLKKQQSFNKYYSVCQGTYLGTKDTGWIKQQQSA